MTDFPARPLSKQDREEILIEATVECRNHECTDLFFEVDEILKSRGYKPDFDTIQLILNEE